MRLLLDDQLAPITSEYGFVEAEASLVADWFRAWEQRTQAERGIEMLATEASGSLTDLLLGLLPLTSMEPRRFLFIQTHSSWTAYFDNWWLGSDAGCLDYVASQLRCRAVRVVQAPDTSRSSTSTRNFGATILELYGPNPTAFLNHERSLAVANDGGRWVFTQAGTPLPFEQLDAYLNRRVRDRFTPELLQSYLRALGIDAFEEGFFGPHGILLERKGPYATGYQEYSLEEARSFD